MIETVVLMHYVRRAERIEREILILKIRDSDIDASRRSSTSPAAASALAARTPARSGPMPPKMPAAVHDLTTLLIVEDELIIALCAGMILEDEGHTVIIAPDGEAGLAQARAVEPDLIITDYMMPRMDGLGMIRALRDAGVTTPILLTTSISEENMQENPHRLHDAYLGKPYQEADLLEAVRALLARDDET